MAIQNYSSVFPSFGGNSLRCILDCVMRFGINLNFRILCNVYSDLHITERVEKNKSSIFPAIDC